MNHTPDGSEESEARKIQREFLESGCNDPELRLEQLCESYPTLAAELRRLDAESGASRSRLGLFGMPAGTEQAQPPAIAVRAGDTIGDFRLLESIARGGQGEVWEALQLSIGRRVALKLVLPGRVNEHTLSLFAREARAGGRLAHPGLVTIFAFGEDGGRHWIAQELVEGTRTLRSLLDEFRSEPQLPPSYYRECAEFLASLCDALQSAHDAGVIHRDVKPQNILITKENRPKLTDFGLARIAGELELSQTGDFAGTWLYMSPEQVTAKRIGLDHRTDVFSLGVVMYELLALQRPFDGDTSQQIAEKIVYWDPPDPSAVRSKVPRDLAVICMKALEKRRDDRFSSMAEFSADLKRWLRNESILARPPSRFDRVRKWVRRNPAKSTAGAFVALGLAVVSTLLLAIVDTNRDLEKERENLASANVDLVEQTSLAERRAEQLAEAIDELESANVDLRDQRALALAQERVARDRLSKILSLSASKDLERLKRSEAELWPAHPDMIPRYESWLAEARGLLVGGTGGGRREPRAYPTLEERRRVLARMRSRARPARETDAGSIDRDSTDYGRLRLVREEREWYLRMLGRSDWPIESVDGSTLPEGLDASDATALNLHAWDLVDPESPEFGRELEAVEAARMALGLGPASERGFVLDTLAWATFRAGKLEEALELEKEALAIDDEALVVESAERLRLEVEKWRGAGLDERRRELETLQAEIEQLEILVGERVFDDPDELWWYRQLVALVEGIESLHDPDSGLAGDTAGSEFGWGIRRRLEFAKTIAQRSIEGPEARALWAEAVASVASSPTYRGTRLSPQIGLLPLGPDPVSGLWEFAHLQSGEPAVRGEDGRLAVSEGTGLVLVLIPGGRYPRGAQPLDPGGRNYDPDARDDEAPVKQIHCSPFFISKYEMTQAQWLRLSGANPSYYQPPSPLSPTLLHPVEQVSWTECDRMMTRMDLALPSEAQWERAARAGTSTVWWTGQARETLRGYVNVADKTAREAGGVYPATADWPDLEDGGVVHTEIGTYAPNPFGLHEILGNVWEWCADGYREDAYLADDGVDPFVPGTGLANHVLRGGGFYDSVTLARCAYRGSGNPETRVLYIGLRPARSLRD